MKTYSGSTSGGFLPATLPVNGDAATSVAPAPEDPSASFADALDQQTPKSFAAAPLSVANNATATLSAPSLSTANDASMSVPDAVPLQPTSPAPFSVTALAWQAPASVVAATVVTTTSSSTTGDSLAADSDSPAPLPFANTWLGKTPVVSSQSVIPNSSTDLSADLTDTAPLLGSAPAPGSPSFPSPSSFFDPPAQKPAVTPSLPASSSLEDNETDLTPTSDLPSQQAGATATPTLPSRAPSSTFGPYVWLGQRSTNPASTSTPSGTSNLSGRFALASGTWSATTPSADSDASVASDADFTGAAIVASVLGRAPASLPAAQLPAAALPTAAAQVTVPSTNVASPVVPSSFTGSPLATIMAHAAILAAASKGTTTSPAASTPSTSLSSPTVAPMVTALAGADKSSLTVSGKASSAPVSSEKKSAASLAERSFLQDGTSTSAPADMVASLLQATVITPANIVGNQTVTASQNSSTSVSASAGLAPISTAGMANGKNGDDMNATLEMTNLVVSTGTHPLVTSTPADLHIALASNHDFTDALHQVMHVAELGNMSRSTPPLRVAIEIQTPPGAIVNVYVSRQSDSSYRAQLSTSDPQALAWVQNQVGSLKGTTESGSAIRWSPAQLEPGTASTANSSGSASGDRGYEWERNGQQGQSGYRQDERAPRRPLLDESDEPEADFATAFSVVGGVA